MASAVARAYNGGLGQSPQQGPRQSSWSGGEEAEAFLAFGRSMEAANLTTFRNFGNTKTLCYLCKKSWETGGRAWSKTGGPVPLSWPRPKTAIDSCTWSSQVVDFVINSNSVYDSCTTTLAFNGIGFDRCANFSTSHFWKVLHFTDFYSKWSCYRHCHYDCRRKIWQYCFRRCQLSPIFSLLTQWFPNVCT